MQNIEVFKQYINSFYEIPENSFGAMYKHCRVAKYPKGQFIIKEMDSNKRIYFLIDGFAKLYTLNEGREQIGKFIEPIDILSFSTGRRAKLPSILNVEAIEDSVLLSISRDSIEELCTTDIHIANWWRIYTENYLCKLEYFYFHTFFLKPEELYVDTLSFLSPTVLNKVPLKSIASFCNLSPESVSRIRNRLVKK